MYVKMNVDMIQSLARNKGMSMARLCEIAGMNRSRATEWKHRAVRLGTVHRVAQVLGVDPIEIISAE